MRFTLRPGLILEEIFGKYLLIADERARQHCQFITELDPTAAEIIMKMMIGTDIREMASEFSETYHYGKEEIEDIIMEFLQKMQTAQFLVTEDMDEEGQGTEKER